LYQKPPFIYSLIVSKLFKMHLSEIQDKLIFLIGISENSRVCLGKYYTDVSYKYLFYNVIYGASY